MKKLFISTILVLFAVCSVKAQQDTIKIHVDGTASLESLMEGVWEQGGEWLRLTGTPTEEDIDYLHRQLDVVGPNFWNYDLRHFELKRIPDRFFAGVEYLSTIILPECLEYIGQEVFDNFGLTVVLTGPFPETHHLSFHVKNSSDELFNVLLASEDNPYCKNFGRHNINYNYMDVELESIYSVDEKTLYFLPHSFLDEWFVTDINVEVPDGTKEIKGYGIDHPCQHIQKLILPESVESIKFGSLVIDEVTCNAINPPTNTGYRTEILELYVPSESFDMYAKNKWAYLHYLNGKRLSSVDDKKVDELKIKFENDLYIINTDNIMLRLILYDITGQLIHQEKINDKRHSFNTSALPQCPILLRVELENGKCETIKIIP